jgi:hypothetical protein
MSGVSISHFANEHPDEPKTPGEYRHQTITEKFPETVTFPFYNINDHNHLLWLYPSWFRTRAMFYVTIRQQLPTITLTLVVIVIWMTTFAFNQCSITSRKNLKKEVSYYGLIVLPSIIRDVSTAILGRFFRLAYRKRHLRLNGKYDTTIGKGIHCVSTTQL